MNKGKKINNIKMRFLIFGKVTLQRISKYEKYKFK
jgi:hypothetical protein